MPTARRVRSRRVVGVGTLSRPATNPSAGTRRSEDEAVKERAFGSQEVGADVSARAGVSNDRFPQHAPRSARRPPYLRQQAMRPCIKQGAHTGRIAVVYCSECHRIRWMAGRRAVSD